ncbi:MAG: acyl-CoA thioesterase [Planctomycetota bacterium]|nr:acyl-CoA thioesterase [Planctomycetota bacterium]
MTGEDRAGATPRGELAIRTLAMPRDTNAQGDVFGGWLMSQMDIAGATVAIRRAQGRVVTVAVEAMSFHKPVFVGDGLSCYGSVTRIGRTSLRVRVEAWARRGRGCLEEKVTDGVFTYVAVDEERRPRPVPPE